MNKIIKVVCLMIFVFMLIGCKNEEEQEEKYFRFKEDVVTIYAGDTYEIEYETNLKDVTLETSDTDIISIDGNVITGLSRGYASIIVNLDDEAIEMTVCVDKHKTEVVYHSLFIDGEEHKVREGTYLDIALKDIYNGNTHLTFDDKKFIDWYLDGSFQTKANLESQISEDMYLYAKYEEIAVVSELRIVLDNIMGYKGEFKKDASVQTISPSFGTIVESEDNNFEAYTFVFVRYDVEELDYFVTEIVKEGTKANTIIPYDGFIICIKNDCKEYDTYMQKLVVGAKISLSKYSVNKAGIVYVNETYTPEHITINPVGVDCKYYSVYDVRSKYMIYSYQGDQKAYPASVTKVITAIAALTNAKLEDTITVGAELDITYEGSSPSTAGIKKGQTWTLRQLLYALLLPSGNDAGYEIAALTINSLYPNNSFEAHEKVRMFSDLMNEVCAKVGANNSHFLTPDGNSYYTSSGAWDERISNHYLTANDMIKIANYAFTFGAIAEVVQTASTSLKTVDGTSYSFTNTNQFLRSNHANYFEYVVGLKTGTTNPAGNCIVTAAEINRRFVIIATFYNYTSAGRYTNSRYLYQLVYGQ